MLTVNFNLPSTGDKTFVLSEHLPCVVYFYPKDNTSGCTNEALDFKDAYPEFQKLGVEVVGISRDSIKSHENFKSKFELPFPLLSDQEENICNQFEVIKLKKMYGKEVMGIERSTFLLDKDGYIIHQWRKIKVPGHVAQVLEIAKSKLIIS